MLEGVRRPVLVAAHSGEPLMAEHAGPHDVGAGIVVVGVGQHARRLGADGVHERQVQIVGHRHRAQVVEEALQQVAEHVGKASGCLEGRQGESELGVHERVARTVVVVGVAGLAAQLVVGDDRVLRGLAAGGGMVSTTAMGSVDGLGALRLEQLPHVVFDARAVGDGLRGVHDAAAAHRDDPVDPLALAQGHALAHERDLGVGPHAAKLVNGHARTLERIAHARDQPACHRRSAAEVDERAQGASALSLSPTCASTSRPNTNLVGDTNSKFSIGFPPFHANAKLPRRADGTPPARRFAIIVGLRSARDARTARRPPAALP